MISIRKSITIASIVVMATLLAAVWFAAKWRSGGTQTLSVAISPYQDIAMIVNIKNLKLEEKYGQRVELYTMPWEQILPAIASAGSTVDVGFGSYIEYLTKESRLNTPVDDPVLFIYPAYVFKGGAFVSFRPDVERFTPDSVRDPHAVERFLQLHIGAQKGSVYEMMLYSLARRAGLDTKSVQFADTPLNDGILATQQGSVDVASAGLTQLTETQKRGGRVVLSMETLGFADITGFIVKRSVFEKKKTAIEKLIRMWFDSVDFVMSDLDRNAAYSLAYLRKNAATQYTLAQYKDALSQEYFPPNVSDVKASILDPSGMFSYQRIGEDVGDYLVTVARAVRRPALPEFITLQVH